MIKSTLCCVGLLLAVSALGQTNEPHSWAELPYWPLGYRLPEAMLQHKPSKDAPKADILVWVPEGAKQIRALFLIPNNSDSKEIGQYGPVRTAAAKHGMAIVYMRNYDSGVEWDKEPYHPEQMQQLFDYLAEQTGIVEFRHAPWITLGKSSRGTFPFRMAWRFPERTIASVTYHGETPTWPVAGYAKLKGETILQVNANGETEWGGTWFNHVRPSLLNYRAKTAWLSHQVVAKDVGHGDYVDASGSPGWGKEFPGKVTCIRVWDYLALFIDKALALRLPKDQFPSKGPLALQQVDESSGYLIDPFAVEESFRVPHLPLKEGADGLYVVGGGEEFPVNGFAALGPLPDFTVPEGVPVVQPVPGKGPTQWLITDSLKFAMAADPMLELGPLQKLMPKVGDTVMVDGQPLTFQPIQPKQVAPEGGIAMNTGLRPPNKNITLLAYTVLDVPEKRYYKVGAGYTAATRIQLVLNGVPVKHKQVLELQPGKYPLLVVVRMSAAWNRIEPQLQAVSEADIALAKQMQTDADQFAAAPPAPRVLIRKASEVPEADRKKMFWVADKELADAWLKLHTVPKK